MAHFQRESKVYEKLSLDFGQIIYWKCVIGSTHLSPKEVSIKQVTRIMKIK